MSASCCNDHTLKFAELLLEQVAESVEDADAAELQKELEALT